MLGMDYDDWKLCTPEEYSQMHRVSKPVASCSDCGCDLYEGDRVYDINGEFYCTDCAEINWSMIL